MFISAVIYGFCYATNIAFSDSVLKVKSNYEMQIGAKNVHKTISVMYTVKGNGHSYKMTRLKELIE